MEKKLSKEMVQKIGAALLGKPIELDGVRVRLVIGSPGGIGACTCCAFGAYCSEEAADFCCLCETSDIDTWVWFERA